MGLSGSALNRLKAGAVVVALAAGVGASFFVEQAVKTSTPPPASEKVADYLTATPTETAKQKPPVMAVVGDSYTLVQSGGWFRNTAACAGHTLALSAVGGSGFIDEGDSPPFGDPKRIAAVTKPVPEIVILETAYNDTAVARRDPARVERAAVDTINAYKKVAPKAKYVILGPFAPGINDKVGVENNLNALQAAAKQTGATHISGMSWLPTPDLIGDDLKHPNSKGHLRIAAHLVDSLKAEGLIESTGGCGLAK